jgi:acyl carrier protein
LQRRSDAGVRPTNKVHARDLISKGCALGLEMSLDIEQELQAIVRTKLKENICSSTKLADAGLDSLDMIEMAFDIEDKFKIQLPQIGSELISFTYGDLRNLVERQLVARNVPEGCDQCVPVSL